MDPIVTTAHPMPVRLRDLTDTEFDRRYGCDRFTASVLGSRFRYIVKHMCTHLMRNAFSAIIRDWYDFAATISGPAQLAYPMAAVSDSLTLFTGVMGSAVANTVTEFGPENLAPGDVLMCNDPVRTGTHPNDMLLIKPVFHDSEIVGFVNLCAHMIDMGGTVPGGFGFTKKNVYENGLVVPPMLLMREDKPVRASFSLIFDNVRFGAIMLPDYLSICADLRLGERLLHEAIDRYGVDAYLGATRYVTDISSEAMAEAIAGAPDGEYVGEDLIDCDGVDDQEQYRIRTTVKIVGSRVEVDLSGSSRQARTCINAGWLDTKNAVGVALKYLLDPITPFTSGLARNIDVVVPIGSIGCPMPPDGAVMFYFEIEEAIVNAMFRALAPALGEAAIAGGIGSGMPHLAVGARADGSPWQSIGTCGGSQGPWGATRRGDADSGLTLYMSNCIMPSAEAVEAEAPVVMLRNEYLTDSSGAGANRGGAATVKDTLWLTDGDHYPNATHVMQPSGTGVLGGGDGTAGAVWYWPDNMAASGFLELDDETYSKSIPVAGMVDPVTHKADLEGSYFYYGREQVWQVRSGAAFRYITSGGGGWGDPLDREPERVLRDVRDEYISVAAARDRYGVVVRGDPVRDPEGLAVDQNATAVLRAQLRSGRL